MLLATLGMAGVVADATAVAMAATAWIAVPRQARLEEAFLLARFPAQYRAYVASTGRFWPRWGGSAGKGH